MRKFKFINIVASLFAATMLFFACDPQLDDKPDIGAAPSDSQIDFTITPGSDDFRFTIKNSSTVTGIASWELGNGSKATGGEAIGYYPLPGDYTVKLTLITRGGTITKTKVVTQTKTDYTIFTDEKFILLSGGVSATNGKTWVLDSLAKGHLGVGPAGSPGLEWWSADPLAKKGVGVLYDDKLNLKITGFAATLTNNGKSYVKGFMVDKTPQYTNAYEKDGDFVVDYTPTPGTWFVQEKGGKVYLSLNGPTPMFPCFDTGAKNGEYEILKLEENLLEMVATGDDGLAWHYQLIPMGYVKPKVTFDVDVVSTGVTNEYAVSLKNVVIPADLSITSVAVDFGDGHTISNSDYQAVIKNTYMRAAPYQVKVTVTTSNETIEKSQQVVVASNHPSYIPFLLDMMVIYNDFSEVSMAPVVGQDCGVSIVDNPSRVYPNKSAKAAFYTKTNQDWANANMQLAPGYRFDLRKQHIFKMMVYGKAGQRILLKLENTDRGGNAWQTGTADLIYTIQQDDTWEVATYDFSGVSAGWNWTGDIFTNDIVSDSNFNNGFYNVLRIMCNPDNEVGTHEFYFDDLAGPHVEGLKSAQLK